MIELRMTGMCENCPHAKLIVECLYTDGDIYSYDVICEYEPACRRAAEQEGSHD